MGTFTKHDVRFPADGGIELGAWLFLPDGASGPRPGITMSHGYAGTKYHGIEPMAEAFAAAEFVVLVHDHRGFGDSDGQPRQDVNPWVQVADWRRSISYLQDRDEVDEERIGLWGTSFSGGHALVLGATDRRLKAVVAQVPTIDGHAAGLRRVAPAAVAGLEAALAADERAQLRGEPPAMQPIVNPDGGGTYGAAEEVAFYLQPIPDGLWENTVTVRSTRWTRMYAPREFVSRVSPTPLLILAADHDNTVLTDLVLGAYEQALEPKRLVMLEGGHFDPYGAQFERASNAAVAWFTEHLER
jgi:uncharacterized protein